jgi:bleomycin hydrolase
MKKLITLLAIVMLLPSYQLMAQGKSKAKFENYKAGFYQNFILKDVNAVKEKQNPEKRVKKFEMDQSGMDLPNNLDAYSAHNYWHFDPISQGNTGTCWCFSTTSFYESEEYRLYKKEVKLSEMFTVYWEYVEKAKAYVASRGKSVFDEGSEANAVNRIYKKYGVVPRSVYDGLIDGREYYSHAEMAKEMKSYLASVKKSNAWNEAEVVSTIKSILNNYMGVPPSHFTYEGKEYSPLSFLGDYLKLDTENYIDVLSYMQQPYWQQVEYEVPDNWWHNSDYYNVPLTDFMKVVDYAIENGYTITVGGDVSEAGFSRETNVALIPDFDIPSDYINDNARQFRFSNKTTTDDHGMHMVGYYKDENGKMWYLIKDSSSGSRNVGPESPIFGYYFFSEEYMKLKIMDILVHKDAFKSYLKKFK